jgi:hypothetical protein
MVVEAAIKGADVGHPRVDRLAPDAAIFVDGQRRIEAGKSSSACCQIGQEEIVDAQMAKRSRLLKPLAQHRQIAKARPVQHRLRPRPKNPPEKPAQDYSPPALRDKA